MMERTTRKVASLLPIGLCLLFAVFTPAQQTTSDAPQPRPFLQRSFAILTGGARIRDVTLSGAVSYYGGSTTESGSAVLTAVGIDQSKFSVNLPSGARSEIRTITSGTPSESGTGPGGVFYTFGSSDLMTAPAWFYP